VRNWLRQKIPVFPEFKAMLTRHVKLKSYLHRFGLNYNLICPSEEEKTTDHLIFQCKRLRIKGNEIIKQIKTLADGE